MDEVKLNVQDEKKEPVVTVLEIQDGVIDLKAIFERVDKHIQEKRNG